MNGSAQDARFEDAATGQPLRLRAESPEDVTVISSLMQDAVGKAGDISWLPKKRRLAIMVNRFRWENGQAEPERVRSALTIDSVLQVRSRGISPQKKDQVYELLAILFEPSADGAGTLSLTLAGGAEIAARVECLDVALSDLTRPWTANAGHAPRHPE